MTGEATTGERQYRVKYERKNSVTGEWLASTLDATSETQARELVEELSQVELYRHARIEVAVWRRLDFPEQADAPAKQSAEAVLDHYDALVTDALDKAAPKPLRDYLGAQADLIDDMREYLVSGIPAGPSDAERVEDAHPLALPPEPAVGSWWRGREWTWVRRTDAGEGWAASGGDYPPSNIPAWSFGAALAKDGPFTAIDPPDGALTEMPWRAK